MYKMSIITIENCARAGVKTQKGDGELFWIRIIDVQKGLCTKNMRQTVKKEIFLIGNF